jgi:hypothetical protein
MEIAACELALGLVNPSDLPRMACDALERGYDSYSLRLLAGLTGTEEARALFERALAELNLPVPVERDAVMCLAKEISKEILDGATPPVEGARRIWDLSLLASGEPIGDLDTFVYAASEWDARPDARPEFEKGILAAARKTARAVERPSVAENPVTAAPLG